MRAAVPSISAQRKINLTEYMQEDERGADDYELFMNKWTTGKY